MRVFVTGGAGFIGSHVAEFYAQRGSHVVVYDNLSRFYLLGKSQMRSCENWNYLGQFPEIVLVEGNVLNRKLLVEHMEGSDVVIHAAAQTAVTTSLEDPIADFSANAHGTLNVLEAVRHLSKPPIVIFCSTNKVFGDNVNRIPVHLNATHYEFADKRFKNGIDENFGIDHCERSPYGCSKLSADLYMQDYAHRYGLKIGIFRMSCIYGPRQFGVEDQGWVAWFAIANHLSLPITIYGDGNQVRDVLHVSDLITAFEAFRERGDGHQIFNLGGGSENSLSLVELLRLLKDITGKQPSVRYENWRASDQKVYISDIRKVKRLLGWGPKMIVREGVANLVRWIEDHDHKFQDLYRSARADSFPR